jgi:hypothetical protein
VFAVGVKAAVAHVGDPLGDAARLCLCGGVALYLTGHAAFRLRMTGQLEVAKLAAVLGVMVVFVVTGSAAAWITAVGVAVVLLLLTIREAAEVTSPA